MKKQKGVVLVLALFILALASSLSYWMMARVARETRSVELLIRNLQATSYAYGSIAWAKTTLQKNATDHVPDRSPDTSEVKEVNHYAIYSTITDMQGKFNINNLTRDEKAPQQFKNLLHVLLPNLNEQQLEEIKLAVMDWISPVETGTFQTFYLTSKPPYRVPHHEMKSISELRLVKGITPEIYDALAPYVAALPQDTKINILTAEAPVIASLKDDMPLQTGQAIQKAIKDRNVKTLEEFSKLELVMNNGLVNVPLADKSDYFLCETHVTRENQSLVVYTLLERLTTKTPMSINVIWQSLQVPG